MNDWFETPVDLDSDAAAVIAKGMRAVARADGIIHQRELSLIAAFEADLPSTADGAGKITDPAVGLAFQRTLIMTALADGVVSDAERACIAELCEEQGLDTSGLDAEIVAVKRKFLSVFAGVKHFRDSVMRVATDLGLTPGELDALSNEA